VGVPHRHHSALKIPEGGGHLWLTPVIRATQDAKIRRIAVQSQPGKIILETLISKQQQQQNPITNKELVGEHLPCRCEDLSSNPIPPKGKKQKERGTKTKGVLCQVTEGAMASIISTPIPSHIHLPSWTF
jgi:hypothetical protein